MSANPAYAAQGYPYMNGQPQTQGYPYAPQPGAVPYGAQSGSYQAPMPMGADPYAQPNHTAVFVTPGYVAGTAADGYSNPVAAAGYGKDDSKNLGGSGGDGGSTSYSGWLDKRVRMGFIRKVFAILSCQLAFTFGITFLFVLNETVKNWVFEHRGVFYAAIAVQFGVIIALACCGNTRRKYPMNMILLAVFTMAQAYLMGTISSAYSTQSVLIAFGITMVVCLSLVAFSFQTKYDFTTCGAGLFAALMVFTVMGIVMIIFRNDGNMVLQTLYAAAGSLLFSVFLVYDIQVLMAGKKIQISPDEYVFAALNLYLDVINIFMFILQLFGKRD